MSALLPESPSSVALEVRVRQISDLAASCRASFRELIQRDSKQAKASIHQRLPLLFHQRRGQKPVLTLSDLRDDFEQFRVWAKNLGVFATDNSSLDYRLREAGEVRSGIISLLGSMQTDLRESTPFHA